MGKKLKFKDYLKALKLIKSDPALKERFDKNKDGFLDPKELEKGAALLGREIGLKPQRHSKFSQFETRHPPHKRSKKNLEKKSGYIANNLLEGEHLIFKTRLHKIIFAGPVVWAVIGMGFLIQPIKELKIASLAFLAFALFSAICIYVQYISSEYGLTNQRLIVKKGLIHRSTLEMFLKKIESIHVDQSALGRVLGYGTVYVSGTGGRSEPYEGICDPLEFKEQVQMQLGKI